MLKIEIQTNSDAFQDGDIGLEIGRILRDTAKALASWKGDNPAQLDMELRDINGETVGTVTGSK